MAAARPRAPSRGRSRTPSRAAVSPRAASPRAASARRAAAPAPRRTPALNPRATAFEFSGPYVGPLGILFGLPLLVWLSAVYCGAAGWPALPSALPTWAEVRGSFSWEALGVYTAWFALQVALHAVVPGALVEGAPLRTGKRLRYKANGWACFLATHVLLGALHASGAFRLTWVLDNYAQLATATIIFSTALSCALYAMSFRRGALLAEGGNSGASRRRRRERRPPGA